MGYGISGFTPMAIAVGIGGILLGGAWRRWEGAALTGLLGHRWLKLSVAAMLWTAITFFWLGDYWQAATVSVLLAAGWTSPANFGTVDGPFPWALSARYGVVTAAVALAVAALARNVGPLVYAPVGLAAPLGYYAARRAFSCWTCAGEVWLGATLYGAIPLLIVRL